MRRNFKRMSMLLAMFMAMWVSSNAQVTYQVIPNLNLQTSTVGTFPCTDLRWGKTIVLVRAADFTSAGVPSNQLLNFMNLRQTLASTTAGITGTVKIWMQTTTDVTNLKSTTWATAISTMTQVANASFTFPSAAGYYKIPFTNFNRGTGGVYIAIEYSNVAGAVGAANASSVNNGVTGLAIRTQTTAATQPTTLAATSFRPEMQLGFQFNNDISVSQVYTLGKMPIEYGAPTIIQAAVQNVGLTTQTNIPVSCVVSGTNSFSDSQTVASLAPGQTAIVNFASYAPSTLSTNDLVTVTTSFVDDNLANNTKTWNMQITPNVYTYKNASQANAGGVGFNGGTGDFVAKFNSNIGQNYPYNINNPAINEIKVDFAAGGQPYNLGIWDATGPGGTPGTLLWQSANLTSAVGTAIIPVPDVSVAGDYFVGVRQTGTTNVSFAYQAESPIRPGTFYYTAPTGGTTWTDFNATASAFRFAIEVSVHIPVPPNCAINLSPADNAGLACYTPTLTWGNGGGGPTGYDVYLSTNQSDVTNLSASALVSVNQTATSYTPAGLSPNTTYYWNIIPKNSDGDAIGCAVQSFTTGILTNCYCVPTQTQVCSGKITNVTMASINNTTSCSAPGYNCFPASGSTTTVVNQNIPTNLSVTCDTASIISVWIDYNHDGTFGTNEWNQVTLASTANVAAVLPLTIPNTSLTGLTLMRIRSRFSGNANGSGDPCTAFGSGEAEDYVIDIQPEPACSGTPLPGNTIASSSFVCNGSTVNLSLQNATAGAGVSYQWYSASDANFTTNVQTLGTATTQSATVTANTYYRCVVTCSGSGLSGTSTAVQVNVNNDACSCTVYCAPTTPNTCDETITNVTFAGINQTSGCNYPYAFFSQTGTVAQGGSYPLTYSVSPYYTSDQVSVFFDWNHDGDFDDVDETFITNNLQNGGVTVNVPATALVGNTRMRVRLAWAQVPTACGSNAYSEAEDYCVTVTPPNNSVLNLTMYLQGYYVGTGSMQPVLNNQGLINPITDCDNVTIELHDATAPYALAQTFTGVLQTNGTISCTFPGSVLGNSYYIVVLQRNHIQTWSASPVTMSGTTVYNFSTAANKAYGDNQWEVEPGVWAFYAGDLNQDLAIDGFDYIDMDPDIVAGNSGYLSTDVDGNGSVDAFDFLMVSPNIDAGVTIQAP